MNRQDAFERILASLHEAMLDDDHWLVASALIDEACRTKGNFLVFGNQLSQEVEIFFARACYRGEHRTDWEREYFEEYYPVDDHLPQLRQLPDSKVVHVTETISEHGLENSLIYNEAMPRFECQNGLSVRLDGPRGSRIIWVIADPIDASGWSSDQIDMVARLLPHIRQFIRVRHALIESGALKTTLNHLLENTRVGVIQIDRHGRIVAVNDRAQALLREGDVLFAQAGALCASSREDNIELQMLLGRALPPCGDQGESGSMVVRPWPGTPPSMVLHVTPVEDPQVDFRTWRAAALVLAVEPKKSVRIDRRVLRTTLGLTPGESEIAALLAEGLSVSEIVQTKGHGIHAVRWHVKQGLSKLGVSRQMDLARIVQAVGGIQLPGRRRDER